MSPIKTTIGIEIYELQHLISDLLYELDNNKDNKLFEILKLHSEKLLKKQQIFNKLFI